MLVVMIASLVFAQGKKTAVKQPLRMPETFENNLRIEFLLDHADDEDHSIRIVTAIPQYESELMFEGEEGAYEFGVSGRVTVRDDGRILLIYRATVAYKGEEESAEFYAASGVLLDEGDPLRVTNMGDRELVIKVSEVIDE